MENFFKTFFFVILILISCSNNKKALTNPNHTIKIQVKFDENSIYNDILNDLVENHFYNRYAGNAGEILHKELVLKKIDSIKYNKELDIIKLKLRSLESENKNIIYLNSNKDQTYLYKSFDSIDSRLLNSQFFKENLKKIKDSLSFINKRLYAKKFDLDLAQIDNVENYVSNYSYLIGKISFSKLYLNKNLDKGLVYYSINCGAKCGKGELLFIVKGNDDRWIVKEKELLFIS
ncbi:hypothetical protein UMM65_10720 [Aureibaculum sp. 2210JD6-5]|uniref:hypothetical protein n=1 Tax=Aureibaculum sp. 2210JD6-5 TaxID=3103957 RepID=UPI002AADC3FD|nr:hypothetical protein [Aureibaculum sp. 2210JD6-5]MDY7395717.1 hypothetical protein [Aureibaculum sp. 2210JD6-5]